MTSLDLFDRHYIANPEPIWGLDNAVILTSYEIEQAQVFSASSSGKRAKGMKQCSVFADSLVNEECAVELAGSPMPMLRTATAEYMKP